MESEGISRYLDTVRERLPLIGVTVAVTTLVAILYLLTATKVYESEADVLVTPVSGDNAALTGLGLLRETSDPTRDVETASRLITSREVAARVRDNLNLDESPSDILKKVGAAPVAQSNIVAITSKADSGQQAKRLADGFATAATQERTAELRQQLDQLIPDLQRRIKAGEDQGDTSADSLSANLAQLQALRASGDPTLRPQTDAAVPDSPSSPKPLLTLLAGIFGGLILGVGGAFLLRAIDPRLRREEQLRERFSLPVLARIPRERASRTTTRGSRMFGIGPTRKVRKALGPAQLSPKTLEAYRTLRAMLAASGGRGGDSRSVLVTGASPSEGKTTSAINLAASLALAGKHVILIEADFRRPTIGEALGVKPTTGMAKVLLGEVKLEDALVQVKPFGGHLRLLLVDHSDEWMAEVLSLPAADDLLSEAQKLADYVIIDSPPLTEVIDALPLAQQVDDVLLVARLGSSNLGAMGRLGDLLGQHGISPSGFVLVGAGSSEEETYYLAARRELQIDEWRIEPDEPAPPQRPVRSKA